MGRCQTGKGRTGNGGQMETEPNGNKGQNGIVAKKDSGKIGKGRDQMEKGRNKKGTMWEGAKQEGAKWEGANWEGANLE